MTWTSYFIPIGVYQSSVMGTKQTKKTLPTVNGFHVNIASAPTKMLGKMVVPRSKTQLYKRFEKKILSTLQCIDETPIWGEYKIWIWKNYLAPSLHFFLMVDVFPGSSIPKMQKITKFINLPRLCTLATVLHPEVLNLPFFPQTTHWLLLWSSPGIPKHWVSATTEGFKTTNSGTKFPKISALYWMQPKNQLLKLLEIPSKLLPTISLPEAY